MESENVEKENQDVNEESVAEWSMRDQESPLAGSPLSKEELKAGSSEQPVQQEAAAAESPSGQKTIKLSAADASSIMSRSATFIPFNAWSQDVGHLSVVEQQLDEPVELTPLQKTLHSKLLRFQGDNNCTVKHCDVLGFCFDSNMRGVGKMVLAHSDDDKIVYATGRHITCVGIDHNHRQMVLRAENCIKINTFDVSSNGKYIAISERKTDAPTVTVYKIDSNAKVASLNFKFLSKAQVIHVSFSSNNKFLATLTDAPDQKLYIWQLDDVKVVAMCECTAPTESVFINPWQSNIMATLGPSSLLLWRSQDKQLISHDPIVVSKRKLFVDKPPLWASHTWFDEDSLAAVTKDGQLVAIEANEVKTCVNLASFSKLEECSQIAWASRGILVTGTNGIVLLLDRTYDESIFAPVAQFHTIDRTSRITSVSVSPAELNIVVALDNNTMEALSLELLNDVLLQQEEEEAERLEEELSEQEREIMMEKNAQVASLTGGFSFEASKLLRNRMNTKASPKSDVLWIEEDLFKKIHHASFHHDIVTSVSFALQRPLLLTTSTDCSIRVYDFVKHEVVLSRKLEDEILSGSIHPMGLHIVLAFRFSVKVYSILDSGDVMQMTELNIKSAHETTFSPNGSRIAFAIANRVIVHDGHNYTFLGMLVGHTSMVKSISWIRNNGLCTCDVVGMLMCWDGTTFKRDGTDSSHKNLILQHGVYDTDAGLFAAVGSNKHARGKIFEGEFTIVCASSTQEETLIYVRPGMVLPKAHASRKQHFRLLAIAKLSKTLFVGTPTGRVLLFSWPLLATSKPYDYIDSHNCEVIHLHLSPNERFLFTVGSDHVMYMYELAHMKAGKFVQIQPFEYSMFDSVRYMLASDMDDKDREIYALKRRLEDRVSESEAQYSLLTRKKEKEQSEFIKREESEIERLRKKNDQLANEITKTERAIQEHTESVESAHIHTAEEIESLYNKQSEDALLQFKRLEAEKEELIVRYETVLANKISSWELTRNEIDNKRRDLEKKLTKEVQVWREKLKNSARRHDGMVAQTVVDMETEIIEMKEAHESKVKTNDDKQIKAATSASVGDRETERQKKELVVIQHQLENRMGVHKDLAAVAEKRQREIKQLKKDMLDRQEAINVAEKNMQQLKQQLAVLENLRFVLTYQFDELQSEVVPKDSKIRQLEHRIVEMEEELQHINVERNAAKERVAQVEEQLTTLGKEQKVLKVRQLDVERKHKTFEDEMWRAVERYRDPLQFAVDIDKVLSQAKQTFNYKEPEVDGEALKLKKELETRQQYLKAKNDHQSTYVKKKQQLLQDQSRELLVDNSSLVQEIKVLRQERKRLQTHCNTIEVKLRDSRVALHRLGHTTRAITAGPTTSATVEPTSTPMPQPRSAVATKKNPLLPPIQGKQTKTVGTKKLGSITKRTQLEDAVEQLETNTERMKDQEEEISQLRNYVQFLLRSEEDRLVSTLSGVSQVNLTSASTQHSQPRKQEGAQAEDLSPDWNVEGEARPMTPGRDLPPTVNLAE